MGLFDRFKKTANDNTSIVEEKMVSEPITPVVDETINEKHDELLEEKNKEKEKYNRLMKYALIKKRLDFLKSLKDGNKIKLSPDASNEIDGWLTLFQARKVNEAYKNFLLYDTELPDISLPEISFGYDDVFYPKNNPFVLDIFESLLDFDNVNESEDHSLLDTFLKPIKEDFELISVQEGIEMEKGEKNVK